MALAARVMSGGFSAGQAIALAGDIASNVTAAGSTQGTATAIKASINYIGTAAASTGVILPAAQPGDSLTIYNGGANTLTIYPPSGAKINGQATNGGVSLAAATRMDLTCITATQWVGNLSA